MHLVDQYIEYLKLERNYSRLTTQAYQKDIEQFSDYCKTEFEIEEITAINKNILRSWVVCLSKNDLSTRSINRKLSAIKGFFNFLWETDCMERNPIDDFSLLKFEKKESIPFSKEEIEVSIGHIDDSNFEGARDKLIIELLYVTGIRRSELINLKISDISFYKKTLTVKGKGNKQRYIPLIEDIVPTIKNYIQLRKEKSEEHNYLFITQKGRKIYDSFVYRLVKKHFRNFTTKHKKSPHILRHSFATHMLEENADLNSIKELLGHESLAATENYVKNDLSMLKKTYHNSHPRGKKDDRQ